MYPKIINSHGEAIDYTFQPGRTEGRVGKWIIILGHGLTGNKDRPILVKTAGALTEAGFDTLRFSFSGNGASGGDFRQSTITKQVGDLRKILSALSTRYPNIAYIGHSMGAAVGAIQASRDKRIRRLISLAGMVDTETFAQTEFGSQIPGEGLMWDEPGCPLSRAFMDDLSLNIRNVLPQARLVTCPWLLIHGTADDVVPLADSRNIRKLKGSGVSLREIKDANHTFSDPVHMQQATSTVVEWLKDLL